MATRFSPNRNRVGIVVNYSYTVRTKNADIPISEQEELVDVTQLEQRTDETEVYGESPTHYYLLKRLSQASTNSTAHMLILSSTLASSRR